MIREIENRSDLLTSVNVLRNSFGTVAREFNLTIKNCPTNAAFITIEILNTLKKKNLIFFGLFLENKQTGFVSLEKANDRLYYLEKLAVLPEYRHHGYGKELMDFCFKYAKHQNIKKISIAIINEHDILKKWYMSYGFNTTKKKKFSHLPFTVCFMEKEVL